MIRLKNGNYNFEGNRMNDKMRELNISTEEDIICIPLGNGVALGDLIEDVFNVREYFNSLLENSGSQQTGDQRNLYTRDVVRKMVAITLIMREYRFQTLPHEDYYLFTEEIRRLTDGFTNLNRDLVAHEIKAYVDEEFMPVTDIEQYNAMIDDIMEFLKP